MTECETLMQPTHGKEILYLSRDQVIACDLSLADIEGAVHNAFLRHSEGQAWSHRKVTIKASGNAVFRGKGGVLSSPNFGAFKWFGYFPNNADRGLRDFSPMVLLNDGSDGLPVAMMDGTWLSEVRTAAITLVAARPMARANSSRIAFVACGAQARRHLETFVRAFPLKEVVAYSRRRTTAEAFAVLAREMGLRAEVTESPEAAVKGADIVISSVPHGAAGGGFLQGDWVSPGTFVAAVDLGFGWRRKSLGGFDRT
ncbi:MAG: ornithine cyclodeaminase family protein, partial [Alphaproteobacteria bacterium]